MSPRAAKKKRADLRNLDFDIRGRDVPRHLFARGRIKFSLGVVRADDPRDREAGRRAGELEKLRKWGGQGRPGAWEILHGLAQGTMEVSHVVNRLELLGEAAVPELFNEARAKTAAPIPTCAQEGERYLGWYKLNRKDKSYGQAKSRLKGFFARPIRPQTPAEMEAEAAAPTVGETGIDQLTKPECEFALDGWKRANTRNAVQGAAQGLFRWSIEDEAERARKAGELPRWTVNPVKMVEMRDSESREVTASESQVLELFAASELYQRAYLRAFIHLGMREMELAHTRLHLDLDLTTWLWKIQKRAPDARCSCESCGGQGWSPKVKRSHRTFHVPAQPDELRGTLVEYLEANPCEPGDFIFRDVRGKMWTEDSIIVDFQRLCAKAGVRYGRDVPGGIVIHDLRATCITRLLLAGEDLGRVAALVGDSADTIMTRYFRPTAHEIGDIVSRGPRYATATPGGN